MCEHHGGKTCSLALLVRSTKFLRRISWESRQKSLGKKKLNVSNTALKNMVRSIVAGLSFRFSACDSDNFSARRSLHRYAMANAFLIV